MSTFEIAIANGDFVLVSELSRREFCLEDLIDGYLRLKERFGPLSSQDKDYMLVWYSRDFSQPLTIRKLGITLEEFKAFRDRLSNQLRLSGGMKLEDAVEGFIRLRIRLGCPDEDEERWMIIYWARDFVREEAAPRVGLSQQAFKMKLWRLKKKAHIKENSPRNKRKE